MWISLLACEIQCTEHDHVLKKIVCEYQDSSFNCDVCKKNGEGWSYCCKICGFDTHLECIKNNKKENYKKVCTVETVKFVK